MHDDGGGVATSPSPSPMLEVEGRFGEEEVPSNDFHLDYDDDDDEEEEEEDYEEGFAYESSYAMLDFVSFEGNHDLLRGVRLSTIMQGAGRIFRSSRGSTDTYRLSHQVESLGYFISHNWSTRRSVKYIALAFKFNFHSAVLAAIVCLTLCTVTSLLGWQPGFDSSDAEYPVSISCRLLVVPCTIFGLFAGGQLGWKRGSPEVFLDKACIDQSSEEAQRIGIQKLGAFLRSSHRMLALFSPVYLTKLWTSFEVAGFLTMHDLRDLELLPLMLPCCFLAMLAMHLGFLLFHVACRLWSLPGIWNYLVTMGGATTYMILVRIWTKQKARIAMLLSTFEVRKATCAQESDRPIVYNNIAVLFKASGYVPKTATVEEALDARRRLAFDRKVRERMAGQFHALFGKYSFSYKEHLLLSLTSFTACFLDNLSGQIGNGAPWQKVLRGHVCDPFWIFTGLTVWQFTTEAITSRCQEWEGWREALLMVFIISTACCGGVAVLDIVERLGKRAETDDTVFYCCLVTVALTTSVTLRTLPKLLSKDLRSRQRTPGEEERAQHNTDVCDHNDGTITNNFKATFSLENSVSKKSTSNSISCGGVSSSRLSSKEIVRNSSSGNLNKSLSLRSFNRKDPTASDCVSSSLSLSPRDSRRHQRHHQHHHRQQRPQPSPLQQLQQQQHHQHLQQQSPCYESSENGLPLPTIEDLEEVIVEGQTTSNEEALRCHSDDDAASLYSADSSCN